MSGRVVDVWQEWDRLPVEVRAAQALRIAVVGAESTGTTGLAKALAAHYRTDWVPEYGREYTEKRAPGPWQTGEFVHIAEQQCQREDEALRLCNRLLICDTNAFATHIWHRRYLGSDSAEVQAIAATRRFDLYLLTGDEIPFEPDPIRDGEHIRHTMHEWFEQALSSQPVRWRLLRGSHETRMAVAIAAINLMFEGSRWQPPSGV